MGRPRAEDAGAEEWPAGPANFFGEVPDVRVLGIDPGTETTGYGVVAGDGGRTARAEDHGVVRTASDEPMEARLEVIYEAVAALLRRHRPDLAAVERLYFKRNVTSAISVGQARGVVLLACRQAGVPVVEYSPPEIKEAVTGYGGADKGQVTRMVRMLLNLPDMRDDAADALAAGLCALFRKRSPLG